MRATVQSSSRRRDDKFLIIAHAFPGKRQVEAVSDHPVRDGQTVEIINGVVK